MAFRQRSVSATTPVVTRMQPSHPGSPDLVADEDAARFQRAP